MNWYTAQSLMDFNNSLFKESAKPNKKNDPNKKQFVNYADQRFWRLFQKLDKKIQDTATKNFELFQQNPNHPSLRFEKLLNGRVSVAVGASWRAVGYLSGNVITWVWIGSHEEYNSMKDRV